MNTSIRDEIDELYRDYQLDHQALPTLLVMNHYDYIALKEEMGLTFLQEIQFYHGLLIRIEEEADTRLENYETYEPTDDYYFGD
tara:strand:+ start:826 stop:1077 length:252 start_codon:yes stop_codon:yes gene_type:complete